VNHAGERSAVPAGQGLSTTLPATACDSALRGALTFWTRPHGVISLETAGHFTGMKI
jgi:hypothetical protein